MTARMRGNMTVNVASLLTFLKNWLTPVISRYPPVGTWEKDIFGATTFVQYSSEESKFFETESYTCNSTFSFTNMNCRIGTGNVIIMEMNDLRYINPEEYIVAIIALCFRFRVASNDCILSLRDRNDGRCASFHSWNSIVIPDSLQHLFI